MNFKKLSFWLFLLLAIVLFCLGGCASNNDSKINVAFDERAANHDTQQSAAIKQQAISLASIGTFQCKEKMSAAECALGQIAMAATTAKEISSLKWQTFTGVRGKTGIDGQIAAIHEVGNIAPTITLGVVSVKAIDKEKGVVNNTSDNGSTVNNSYDEDHATNLGDDSTAGNYPAQNNSTENAKATE